jgi:hypothetical protein
VSLAELACAVIEQAVPPIDNRTNNSKTADCIRFGPE